jgi:hypothetical protein
LLRIDPEYRAVVKTERDSSRYEALENDPRIQKLKAEAEEQGQFINIERMTLAVTFLGMIFCEACILDEVPNS